MLKTPVGTEEGWVAIEDVEFERVGDDGRCSIGGTEPGGEGAVSELAELRC